MDSKIYTLDSIKGNPMQLFASLAIMMRGHDESDKKSSRVMDAWRNKFEKAKQGQTVTKILPAWITLDPKDRNHRLAIPERVEIIKRIFKECIENGKGSHTIANELNSEGVQPWKTRNIKNKSGLWSQTYINKILTSRALIGEITFNGHMMKEQKDSSKVTEEIKYTVPDYYPAIMTENDLKLAALARSKRVKGATKGRNANMYRNLFTGVARCVCGSHLSYTSCATSSFLKCSRGTQCEHGNVNYDVVEKLIVETMPSVNWLSVARGEQDKLETVKRKNEQVEIKIRDLQANVDELAEIQEVAPSLAMAKKIQAKELEIDKLKKTIKPINTKITNKDYKSQLQSTQFFGKRTTEERQKINQAIHDHIHTVTCYTVIAGKKGQRPRIAIKTEMVDGKTYYILRHHNKISDMNETVIWQAKGKTTFMDWIEETANPFMDDFDIAERLIKSKTRKHITTYYSDMLDPT